MATPLVEMRGIAKSFGATRALQGVDVDLYPGEVHAIVGENGAGKSTLGRCLAGLYPTYDGTILVDGRELRPTSPDQARAAGIAMVHQELNLVPYLSVAENIFLGTGVGALRFGMVNRKTQARAVAGVLQRLRIAIDPTIAVVRLSLASRQIVEIAKALVQNPRVLILDEPTSALTLTETQSLLNTVAGLREEGLAVAYVSHRLEEIFAIADRITVLRDGRLVKTLPAHELTQDALVRLMVGRGVSDLYRPPDSAPGAPVLTVSGLTRRGEFQNVSFAVHAGEVLGLAGLIGAGRSQVAETIYGLRRAEAGEISVDGRRVEIKSPVDAIRNGVYLVPEDRRGTGIVPLRSVRENLSLPFLARFSAGSVVRRPEENATADRIIKELSIRCRNREQHVAELSGGNQQKVVVGKWLVGRPRVLILDEPTRGIDIAAKADLHATMRSLAAEGVAILLISSELPEIVGASQRVLVLRNGEVVAELERPEISEHTIMGYAAGTAGRRTM